MTRPARITKRQKQIMGKILREAGAGRFMTLTELHDELPDDHKASYGSLRKSLDFLERSGIIVREHIGGNKKHVKPTELGFKWFRPTF